MPKYELIYVLRTDQPQNELDARAERAAAVIAEHKGEITARNVWGVRRLTYEIQHQTQGHYTFLAFRAEGSVVAELEKLFRQDDGCLRHLVVVDEEWGDRNRAAQARAHAAAAASRQVVRPPAEREDEE